MSDLLYKVNKFVKDSERLITTEKALVGDNTITKFGADMNSVYSSKFLIDSDRVIGENTITAAAYKGGLTFEQEVYSLTISITYVTETKKITKIKITNGSTAAATFDRILFNNWRFFNCAFATADGSVKFNCVSPNILIGNETTVTASGSIELTVTGGSQQSVEQITTIATSSQANNEFDNQIPSLPYVQSQLNAVDMNVDGYFKVYEKELTNITFGTIAYAVITMGSAQDAILLMPYMGGKLFTGVSKTYNNNIDSITIIGLEDVGDVIMKVNGKEYKVSCESNKYVLSLTAEQVKSVSFSVSGASIASNSGMGTFVGVAMINNYGDSFMFLNLSGSGAYSIYKFAGTESDNPNALDTSIQLLSGTASGEIKFIGELHSTTSGESVIAVIDYKAETTSGTETTPAKIYVNINTATETLSGEYIDAAVFENQLYVMYKTSGTATSEVEYADNTNKVIKMSIFVLNKLSDDNLEVKEICSYEVLNENYNKAYYGTKYFTVSPTNTIASTGVETGVESPLTAGKIMIDDRHTYYVSNNKSADVLIRYDCEGNLFIYEGGCISNKFANISMTAGSDPDFESFASYGPYVFFNKGDSVYAAYKQYKYINKSELCISDNKAADEPKEFIEF